MRLPDTSHYTCVETMVCKERMDHQVKTMRVKVLVDTLVKDIFCGAGGPFWQGAFARVVRFVT